jgi:tetratricopeptide (TPR) repeat protein
MSTARQLYISSSSRDLDSSRDIVADIGVMHGFAPIVRASADLGGQTPTDSVRRQIVRSHCVVCLLDQSFGSEPSSHDDTTHRRSYAQLEYDYAVELKKPIFTFFSVSGSGWGYTDIEPANLRRLQLEHMKAVDESEHESRPFRTNHDLADQLDELLLEFTALLRLRRGRLTTRVFGGLAVAVVMAIVAQRQNIPPVPQKPERPHQFVPVNDNLVATNDAAVDHSSDILILVLELDQEVQRSPRTVDGERQVIITALRRLEKPLARLQRQPPARPEVSIALRGLANTVLQMEFTTDSRGFGIAGHESPVPLALQLTEAAIEVDERRTQEAPSDILAQIDLSRSYQLHGAALKESGSIAESEEAYRHALAIRDAATAHEPPDIHLQAETASVCQFLGDLRVQQGDLDEALAHYSRAMTLLKTTETDDVASPEIQLNTASCHERIGILHRHTGNEVDSRTSHEQAYAIRIALHQTDQDNVEILQALARSLNHLGWAASSRGNLDTAARYFEEELSICRQVDARTNNSWHTQRSLALAYRNVAIALKGLGDTAKRLTKN